MFDYPDPEQKVVVAPYLEIEDGTISIEQYTIPIDASVSEAVATLEDQIAEYDVSHFTSNPSITVVGYQGYYYVKFSEDGNHIISIGAKDGTCELKGSCHF